jgi:hypothetical protein
MLNENYFCQTNDKQKIAAFSATNDSVACACEKHCENGFICSRKLDQKVYAIGRKKKSTDFDRGLSTSQQK